MIELDGNAIAGDLESVFGTDLSAVHCVCASCGARAFVAESVVYTRGPGTVARCRSCGAVLMVLVTIRAVTCTDLRGLAALETEV
jgi:hypothetical protein